MYSPQTKHFTHWRCAAERLKADQKRLRQRSVRIDRYSRPLNASAGSANFFKRVMRARNVDGPLGIKRRRAEATLCGSSPTQSEFRRSVFQGGGHIQRRLNIAVRRRL